MHPIPIGPEEVELLNRVNDLTGQIQACGNRDTPNHCSVSFSGRIGAKGWGTISFCLNRKDCIGERDFNGLEDCLDKLLFVLDIAKRGRW